MRYTKYIVTLGLLFLSLKSVSQTQKLTNFTPGEIWKDNEGNHINAHGGGVLYSNGTYYWFGEHKGSTNDARVGVTCYSSKDLYNWKNEGVALPVSKDPNSEITSGSVIERPKVIYNKKTKKYVMWFHLELKGQGYKAARTAVATSDKPIGPYVFVRSYRPNVGNWPKGFNEEWKKNVPGEDTLKWWTPKWREAVKGGLFVRRDFARGQMARDMQLFVDDDGKGYHIHSSEDNLTLHVSELTDDYLDFTSNYITIAPAGHNEAPALFKQNGVYYLITSGCTGWDPNAARSFKATSMWGPWESLGNPCIGKDADITFDSQSTYILPVAGKKDAFIFMADRWRPKNPIDGRYIWLPIKLENGKPVLEWKDKWTLNDF
ncbi:family 43 glycosylhydrolase [Flavobacterium sp. Sd200]|uniref:glycoside hydrolase family 43 protein n=1 Tax=Flavobacterium sp. Sd200 TaxID=2692211 RepID=UPI00136B99E6|nr:glycoside hydrolase family 43 protein [Flavobacterium sp. Sd200]MXN90906.1 family 43 glycosylhydrolase [Flavobacterium sp. Sd200]